MFDESHQQLDPAICRQARLSRDRRFDGEFFLAVKTTGIYCRPVCPARPPAERNVSYFRSAAQAASSGYRPCLRCRPESAPGSAAWEGTSTTVQRALHLIRAGALYEGSLGDLADRLGIGERYLRKLFEREVGASPRAVALNQRLLFAKKLLTETSLPITEVAYAAGFGSLRRFNSTFRDRLKLTPGELRKQGAVKSSDGNLRLQLTYRPPYDWEGVIDFFARHAVEGVEQVNRDSYQRNIRLGTKTGRFSVRDMKKRGALELQVEHDDLRELMPLVARVRRMFDLDANPGAIEQTLGRDPALAPLLDKSPGVRAPGYWSLFEAAVRAVVGQQVSIAAARTICARLAAAASGECTKAFPSPTGLATLPDESFSMPTRRRETLRSLCRLFEIEDGSVDMDALADIPGIGPWTLAMIDLRGTGNPDSLPAGDLGLEKAWQALSPETNLNDHAAEQWRPWRSYAANLLWRSLNP